jgi:predicted dinucleotide-binding enzyme
MFEGHRALMLMAGDDAEAKAVVRRLGEDVGLEMEDAGGLSNARLLEALAELWIYLAFRGGLGRDFAFAALKR